MKFIFVKSGEGITAEIRVFLENGIELKNVRSVTAGSSVGGRAEIELKFADVEYVVTDEVPALAVASISVNSRIRRGKAPL